jgi:hypothetical protein
MGPELYFLIYMPRILLPIVALASIAFWLIALRSSLRQSRIASVCRLIASVSLRAYLIYLLVTVITVFARNILLSFESPLDWSGLTTNLYITPLIGVLSVLIYLVFEWRRRCFVARLEGSATHLEVVLHRLRERAVSLRAVGNSSLVFSMVVLASTLSIFVFAEEIVARHATRQDAAQEITAALRRVFALIPAEEHTSLANALADMDVTDWVNYLSNGYEPQSIAIEQWRLQEGYWTAALNGVHVAARNYAESGPRDTAEILQITSRTLPGAPDDLRDLVGKVPVMLTRVGAVAIAIFVTQILVALYRYCAQMAAFCDGRADAIELSHSEENEFAFPALVEALAGEKVSFGKTPRGPVEEIVKLAQTLVAAGWLPPPRQREE